MVPCEIEKATTHKTKTKRRHHDDDHEERTHKRGKTDEKHHETERKHHDDDHEERTHKRGKTDEKHHEKRTSTKSKSERKPSGNEEEGKRRRPKVPKEKEKADPAMKMMKKMGYKPGEGLGAKKQGIKEPLLACSNKNRQGFGLKGPDTEVVRPRTVWKEGMDTASVKGNLLFGVEGEKLNLEVSELSKYIKLGERKVSIDGETRYCDSELLSELVKAKSMLNENKNFGDARARSNPYEHIGAGIFLNRAAMKMANIDSVMDGLFTKTLNNETLYFADICAGPGGFTEYMLWRRPMESCGFGFTLRESNDFKLEDIVCGPVQCFHPSYGEKRDGDIFNENNLKKFQHDVLISTEDKGVHIVLGDGGFSVEGQENIQEILSKQLYVCQFLCSINILRKGGTFLCKLFDIFSDFSVGLIRVVSSLFRKIYIIKPITSRPANSERYIIFKDFSGKSTQAEEIIKYLYEINRMLNEYHKNDKDVLEIYPLQKLMNCGRFCDFIRDSNNQILKQQILALVKLYEFILDRNLFDERQLDIKTEALKVWNVPNVKREKFKNLNSPSSFSELVNIDNFNNYGSLTPSTRQEVIQLTNDELAQERFVVRNHYAGFLSSTSKEFRRKTYVIIKDKKVLRWFNAGVDRHPDRIEDETKKWALEIPSFTILLVHFGTEYRGKKTSLRYRTVTVIDAAAIYAEDISYMSYTERLNRVINLCNLLDPKHSGIIKPIEIFPLVNMFEYLSEKVTIQKPKGLPTQEMINSSFMDTHFPPGVLIIINFINHPWMQAVSKSSGKSYYYNVESRQSSFDKPDDLYSTLSKSTIYEVDWTDDAYIIRKDEFLKTLRRKI